MKFFNNPVVPQANLPARFIRRMLDLSLSSFGLLVLSPFFLIIALAIKRDSPGPAFFWGTRIGKDGRRFKILKFRTMYERPESHAGPRVTAQDDPRITPIGQWLRDTKLNELPQLWNVLKGDMSLVGPRPEDPEIIKDWPPETRKLLLSVRPGITSPASIAFRDEEAQLNTVNVMDEYLYSVLPSKLRLDSLYVRNRTTLTDLDVLFTTLYALIPRARKIPIPEARLYWGPFSNFFNRTASWFLVDFFVSLVSVAVVGIIWRSITPLDIGWSWAPLVALAFAVVFSVSNAVFGTHEIYWRRASPREALDLGLSTVIAVALLWLVDQFALQAVDVPDGLFIVASILAALGFFGVRYRERILTGMAYRWLRLRRQEGMMGEPVLIIGAGELGQFAAWLIRKSDLARAFSIAGCVDDDPSIQGMRIDGMRVLGTTRELNSVVARHEPGLILYAISKISSADQHRILQACRSTGVQVVMIPDVIRTLRKHFKEEVQEWAAETIKSKKVPTGDVIAWLSEIELLAAAGDLEGIRAVVERAAEQISERVQFQ